jgi:hypothetical protein
MTPFLSPTVTIMEVTTMWIKTQGGYLLNLDKVQHIYYEEPENYTYAHTPTFPHTHIIGTGDLTTTITDAIMCGTKIMEVR